MSSLSGIDSAFTNSLVICHCRLYIQDAGWWCALPVSVSADITGGPASFSRLYRRRSCQARSLNIF